LLYRYRSGHSAFFLVVSPSHMMSKMILACDTPALNGVDKVFALKDTDPSFDPKRN
jgi:hypothetical protein